MCVGQAGWGSGPLCTHIQWSSCCSLGLCLQSALEHFGVALTLHAMAEFSALLSLCAAVPGAGVYPRGDVRRINMYGTAQEPPCDPSAFTFTLDFDHIPSLAFVAS